MKRSTVLMLTLLCLSPALCLAADVDEHLLSGSKFVQEKKLKEALREFETAVQISPDHARANLLLGLTLAGQNEPERAAVHLEKSVRLEPGYAGYYNLGLVYANQSKFDQAVQAYEKAVEINARSYEVWHQMGKVYAAALRFDKAVEAYRKAAALNPKFPDAYQGMGSAFYWSGDLTSALQQVDELNKMHFETHARQLERWIKDKEAKKKKKSPPKAAPVLD